MFNRFPKVQYKVGDLRGRVAARHERYFNKMFKLYRWYGKNRFREMLKDDILDSFKIGDMSAKVDRVLQFTATFCTCIDMREEFLPFIFDIILDCQCASNPSVRYRSTQLLAAVMSAIGPDSSLDVDLYDKLLASLMQRLQDTQHLVRRHAVLALYRLQNPTEEDDAVTRAYHLHMSHDPSPLVRRAVVQSIGRCWRNLPLVLERLYDVDETVCSAAYLYIGYFNVTLLEVRQIVLTLKVGLTERRRHLRHMVEDILIPRWLRMFRGNILELLKAMSLDNAEDFKDTQYVAGKLLESIFKRLPISELLIWLPTDESLRLIPAELNKESAWYWRHLAEHLYVIDDGETLKTVLPDLVQLTGDIRAFVESPCPSETEDPVGFSTRQWVLHELASMLPLYDTADPAGRSALHALITDVLTGDYGLLNNDVIRAFVSALELAVPEVSDRMEVIGGVIKSLRTPPDQPPPQVISARAKCQTINKELSDAATLTKCLTILNFALASPQLETVTPIMQTIFNELEAEIFQNPEIIETALKTVALFGLLDKKFAIEKQAFFFTNLLDTSKERTVSAALCCIANLLRVHGVNLFENESNQEEATVNTNNEPKTSHRDSDDDDGSKSESAISVSPAHGTVIQLLLTMMDSANGAPYRLIIVRCLCNLLYVGLLESPAILSRLLLLLINPDTGTDDEDMMKQIIGEFFETFPTAVDGARQQILKATLPTLRALADAPSHSALAEVDKEAVVRFIVSLTKVNNEELSDQPSYLKRYLDALGAAEPVSHTAQAIGQSTHVVVKEEPEVEETFPISAAQAIGQSTHVVVNHTVKEEPEVEETFPISAAQAIGQSTRGRQ